jgi:hypothetical protein
MILELFIISSQIKVIFYGLMLFLIALILAKSRHLLSKSRKVPLIWYSYYNYLIKLSPIAPVPHPKSTNLSSLPLIHFFLIYLMASVTRFSVSNRGIRIGGLTFKMSSRNAHSPIIY